MVDHPAEALAVVLPEYDADPHFDEVMAAAERLHEAGKERATARARLKQLLGDDWEGNARYRVITAERAYDDAATEYDQLARAYPQTAIRVLEHRRPLFARVRSQETEAVKIREIL